MTYVFNGIVLAALKGKGKSRQPCVEVGAVSQVDQGGGSGHGGEG